MTKLPNLITENHGHEWMARLQDTAIIAVGKTEQEAIDELMISIKVQLLHDKMESFI